jgi:hypothetical protein
MFNAVMQATKVMIVILVAFSILQKKRILYLCTHLMVISDPSCTHHTGKLYKDHAM